MNPALRFSTSAEDDLQTAAEWYRERGDDLELRFRFRVEEALARIIEHPELYPRVLQNVRRAVIRHFPYSLFFRSSVDGVFVVGVLHQARDPRTWKKRARES